MPIPPQPVGGGSAAVAPFNSVSALEGISGALAGRVRVLYNPGILSPEEILDGTRFWLDAQGTQPGLRGEYFASPDFSGTPQVRTDPGLAFHWKGASLEARVTGPVSIRWTGYFIPASTGTYLWQINSSGRDISRFFLDGRLVRELAPREGQVPVWLDLPMEAGRAYAVKFEVALRDVWRQQMVGLGAIAADAIVTPEAARIAANADAVVVCIGYSPTTETEGADRAFELGIGQDQLVEAVCAANPKTIVVLTAGGSADASRWIDRVPAFLHAWYTGQEGGAPWPACFSATSTRPAGCQSALSGSGPTIRCTTATMSMPPPTP